MEAEGGGSRPRRRTRSAVEMDGLRVPPHSVEAEQAVLGGLLLDNSTWDAIADRLRAEDFYRRDHQLIFTGIAELSASAYDSEGRTATELVDEAERRVFEIAEQGRRSGSGFVPIREVLGATIDRLDMLHQNQGQLTGVSTGYHDLDRMTAGLQPGDLIVVAGRPSMG